MENTPRNGQRALMTNVVIALVSSITVFFIFWMTIAGNRVDRKEVLELIQTTAPYVLDRNVLISGMESNTRAISDMKSELRDLTVGQAKLIARVNILLESYDGPARVPSGRPE